MVADFRSPINGAGVETVQKYRFPAVTCTYTWRRSFFTAAADIGAHHLFLLFSKVFWSLTRPLSSSPSVRRDDSVPFSLV